MTGSDDLANQGVLTLKLDLVPLLRYAQFVGDTAASVLIDAGPREILRFAGISERKQLRGVACSGQLVVFPEWHLTHHHVRTAFGMPGYLAAGTDFWIIQDGDDPLSPDWDASDDDPCKNGFRLIVGRRGDDDAILPLKSWFQASPTAGLSPRRP